MTLNDLLNLNDLLTGKGIDPQQVLVMRHSSPEPKLKKILPWLAAEKPDVFNAYQQTHNPNVEKSMLRARYVTSFIGYQSGKALFIGLYSIQGSRSFSYVDWSVPAYIELRTYTSDDARSSTLWFDLAITDFYAHWKGKLVVGWPAGRLYCRRAHQTVIPIVAVLEDSALDAAMPEWERIDLSWDELTILPKRWKEILSQWRAVYFIFDEADGKGYVGSAYGRDKNLLGRWLNYAASGHGGNKLLCERDPKSFRFTILQRLSPDMELDDVIRLEETWKDRLHTRWPHGLNEN
jgi:hypothetical protein